MILVKPYSIDWEFCYHYEPYLKNVVGDEFNPQLIDDSENEEEGSLLVDSDRELLQSCDVNDVINNTPFLRV